MDTSNFFIQTRRREMIQDDPADSSSSTPNKRISNRPSPTRWSVRNANDAGTIRGISSSSDSSNNNSCKIKVSIEFLRRDENVPREDQQFPRQAMPKEVPLTAYRNTTSVSCDKLTSLQRMATIIIRGRSWSSRCFRQRTYWRWLQRRGNVLDSQTPTPQDIQLGRWLPMKKEITSLVLMTSSCTHMTSPDDMWQSTLRHQKVCNFYFQRPQHLVMESCFGMVLLPNYSEQPLRMLWMLQASWEDEALTATSTFSMIYIIYGFLSRKPTKLLSLYYLRHLSWVLYMKQSARTQEKN